MKTISESIYSNVIGKVLERLNEEISESSEKKVFSYQISVFHEPIMSGVRVTLSIWWTRYPPSPNKMQPRETFYVRRYSFTNNIVDDVVEQAKERIPEIEKDFIWEITLLGIITMQRNHSVVKEMRENIEKGIDIQSCSQYPLTKEEADESRD